MTKSGLGKVWTFLCYSIYEKRVCLNFDTPSLFINKNHFNIIFHIALSFENIQYIEKKDNIIRESRRCALYP